MSSNPSIFVCEAASRANEDHRTTVGNRRRRPRPQRQSLPRLQPGAVRRQRSESRPFVSDKRRNLHAVALGKILRSTTKATSGWICVCIGSGKCHRFLPKTDRGPRERWLSVCCCCSHDRYRPMISPVEGSANRERALFAGPAESGRVAHLC